MKKTLAIDLSSRQGFPAAITKAKFLGSKKDLNFSILHDTASSFMHVRHYEQQQHF
jgi:hypothetical protein